MTPTEYLTRLRALVVGAEYTDALIFAERWGPAVFPRMTAAEYQRATTLLEGPTMLLAAGECREAATPSPLR